MFALALRRRDGRRCSPKSAASCAATPYLYRTTARAMTPRLRSPGRWRSMRRAVLIVLAAIALRRAWRCSQLRPRTPTIPVSTSGPRQRARPPRRRQALAGPRTRTVPLLLRGLPRHGRTGHPRARPEPARRRRACRGLLPADRTDAAALPACAAAAHPPRLLPGADPARWSPTSPPSAGRRSRRSTRRAARSRRASACSRSTAPAATRSRDRAGSSRARSCPR